MSGDDLTAYKLINSNTVRDLKAGTNISITTSGNDLTINGPSLTGFATTSNLSFYQPLLAVSGDDTTKYKLINGTSVRDLTAGTNITITNNGNDLTIGGPTLTGYLNSAATTQATPATPGSYYSEQTGHRLQLQVAS